MANLGATVRRTYQIERVPEHTIEENVAVMEKGKYVGFQRRKRVVKDGFMVYFPRGHSLFVENEDQLARLHLDRDGGMVDMATGMSITDAGPVDLRAVVHRATRAEPAGVEGNIMRAE